MFNTIFKITKVNIYCKMLLGVSINHHHDLERLFHILLNAIAYLSYIIMYTPVLGSKSSIWNSFLHARVSLLKFPYDINAFSYLLAYYLIDRHRSILLTAYWNAPLSRNNYLLIRFLFRKYRIYFTKLF